MFSHFFFAHEKLKKNPQNDFFFLLPWSAQMTQTEEFISQNFAYGPTVYKTGLNSTGVKFVHRICKLPTYRQSCVR